MELKPQIKVSEPVIDQLITNMVFFDQNEAYIFLAAFYKDLKNACNISSELPATITDLLYSQICLPRIPQHICGDSLHPFQEQSIADDILRDFWLNNLDFWPSSFQNPFVAGLLGNKPYKSPNGSPMNYKLFETIVEGAWHLMPPDKRQGFVDDISDLSCILLDKVISPLYKRTIESHQQMVAISDSRGAFAKDKREKALERITQIKDQLERLNNQDDDDMDFGAELGTPVLPGDKTGPESPSPKQLVSVGSGGSDTISLLGNPDFWKAQLR